MYYKTMLTGKPFEEPGARAYQELQKDKYLRRVKKQIGQWGYKIISVDAPAVAPLEAQRN